MMAPALLVELEAQGVHLTAHGDRLVFDAPAGTMTPERLALMKAHKLELLTLLTTGRAVDVYTIPPAAPEPEISERPESQADAEIARFLAAARPWPDGRGWYDPREQARLTAPVAPPRLQAGTLANAKPPGGLSAWGESADGQKTAVERAARYRAAWEREGYPPGAWPVLDT